MPREFPKNDINRKVIYLIIWMVLFFLVATVILIGAKKSSDKRKLEDKTPVVEKENDEDFEIETKEDPLTIFTAAKENLLKLNYEFSFEHIIEGNKVIYNGKSLGNKVSLTREDALGITKLYIEDDILYQVSLDNKTKLDVTIDHNTYLDVDYLFSKVTNTTASEDGTYQIELDGIIGIVTLNNNEISKIEINNEIESYLLEFRNVSGVTSVD